MGHCQNEKDLVNRYGRSTSNGNKVTRFRPDDNVFPRENSSVSKYCKSRLILLMMLQHETSLRHRGETLL